MKPLLDRRLDDITLLGDIIADAHLSVDRADCVDVIDARDARDVVDVRDVFRLSHACDDCGLLTLSLFPFSGAVDCCFVFIVFIVAVGGAVAVGGGVTSPAPSSSSTLTL